jgi:hypothetical protein
MVTNVWDENTAPILLEDTVVSPKHWCPLHVHMTIIDPVILCVYETWVPISRGKNMYGGAPVIDKENVWT